MIRVRIRRQVRLTYVFRCGYCGLSEEEAGSELTIDHYQPVSHGGTDDINNLVYACHTCNEFNGNLWNPQTPNRILHPLNDDLTLHYILQDDGAFAPLTPTGDFHISRLRLNRPPLVAHRLWKLNQQAALQERTELLQKLEQIDQRLERLEACFDSLSQL